MRIRNLENAVYNRKKSECRKKPKRNIRKPSVIAMSLLIINKRDCERCVRGNIITIEARTAVLFNARFYCEI